MGKKNYISKSCDIILFDWRVDVKFNHVGIVEKVENGRIYTVEVNSTNDTCSQKDFSIDSNVIYGYGIPMH